VCDDVDTSCASTPPTIARLLSTLFDQASFSDAAVVASAAGALRRRRHCICSVSVYVCRG
jgi:hypothetical protein